MGLNSCLDWSTAVESDACQGPLTYASRADRAICFGGGAFDGTNAVERARILVTL